MGLYVCNYVGAGSYGRYPYGGYSGETEHFKIDYEDYDLYSFGHKIQNWMNELKFQNESLIPVYNGVMKRTKKQRGLHEVSTGKCNMLDYRSDKSKKFSCKRADLTKWVDDLEELKKLELNETKQECPNPDDVCFGSLKIQRYKLETENKGIQFQVNNVQNIKKIYKFPISRLIMMKDSLT